jgi:hypothetical protein
MLLEIPSAKYVDLCMPTLFPYLKIHIWVMKKLTGSQLIYTYDNQIATWIHNIVLHNTTHTASY